MNTPIKVASPHRGDWTASEIRYRREADAIQIDSGSSSAISVKSSQP